MPACQWRARAPRTWPTRLWAPRAQTCSDRAGMTPPAWYESSLASTSCRVPARPPPCEGQPPARVRLLLRTNSKREPLLLRFGKTLCVVVGTSTAATTPTRVSSAVAVGNMQSSAARRVYAVRARDSVKNLSQNTGRNIQRKFPLRFATYRQLEHLNRRSTVPPVIELLLFCAEQNEHRHAGRAGAGNSRQPR